MPQNGTAWRCLPAETRSMQPMCAKRISECVGAWLAANKPIALLHSTVAGRDADAAAQHSTARRLLQHEEKVQVNFKDHMMHHNSGKSASRAPLPHVGGDGKPITQDNFRP